MSVADLLGFVLRERPAPAVASDVVTFWNATTKVRDRFALPFDRAVAGGFVSDRLAFAFACGYQAALRVLVPSLPLERIVSFCVTEEGGNHPRAVQATLERAPGGGFTLSGTKRWCVANATTLVVVARDVTAMKEAGDARPRLRAVCVDVTAPGVVLTPMPPTAFVPEMLHAELRLEVVVVSEHDVLPGDGYDVYTKPFRTVEDLHVQGGLLGYLSSVAARSAWPDEIRERLVALVALGRGLAPLDPRSPETHLALAGFLAQTAALVVDAEPHWVLMEAAERERWYRDRLLVQVASKARATRRERAWQSLGSEKR